jgi:hypothetical protein
MTAIGLLRYLQASTCSPGQLGCERVIFVGDDYPDEDVFSRDWDGGLRTARSKSTGFSGCWRSFENRPRSTNFQWAAPLHRSR